MEVRSQWARGRRRARKGHPSRKHELAPTQTQSDTVYSMTHLYCLSSGARQGCGGRVLTSTSRCEEIRSWCYAAGREYSNAAEVRALEMPEVRADVCHEEPVAFVHFVHNEGVLSRSARGAR